MVQDLLKSIGPQRCLESWLTPETPGTRAAFDEVFDSYFGVLLRTRPELGHVDPVVPLPEPADGQLAILAPPIGSGVRGLRAHP